MLFYGIRSAFLDGDPLGAVIELYPTREEAEEAVGAWDRDEPEAAGLLDVIEVEFPVAPN